ncbi:MAG: hypothetical protein DDT22_00851 [candidate division WS2 bacterium]|nr:hypothetical protein [Candidatus Lithacetigena glycinireducens]
MLFAKLCKLLFSKLWDGPPLRRASNSTATALLHFLSYFLLLYMLRALRDYQEVIPPPLTILNLFFTIPPGWDISTCLRYSPTIIQCIMGFQMVLKYRIYHLSSGHHLWQKSIQPWVIKHIGWAIYIQRICIIFH